MTDKPDDTALHLLEVLRCHEPGQCPADESACWDTEVTVLHSEESCCPVKALGDEDTPGPSYRCMLAQDEEMVGLSALMGGVWADPDPWEHLPSGRYLIAWWCEDGGWNWEHTEYDWRSGVELVPGPVWAGDREGWDLSDLDGTVPA